MLRIVFDTNLFVSSLLVKRGIPARALDAWRQRRITLLTSPAIMTEIAVTLSYDRIRRKYGVTDEDVSRLIDLLSSDALMVPGKMDVSGSVPADSDDEIVLACALEGKADLIVSGDQHLLALGEFKGIPIITARQFLTNWPMTTSKLLSYHGRHHFVAR